MFLMFSFGREDVFSLGDLGLRNAVARLYEVDRDDLKKIEEISQQWKPYRSLASRYLWKSLDNTPKE
jgi:DNA-3-methyladenine glycosylase II